MLEWLPTKWRPKVKKFAFVQNPLDHQMGHFYSPIVDLEDAKTRSSQIWPPNPLVLGVEFNDESHLNILTKHFPQFIDAYDYPENGPADPNTRIVDMATPANSRRPDNTQNNFRRFICSPRA